MLNSFSDALTSRLQSALPDQEPVARARLTDPAVPRPVSHFLEHTLERRLELEGQHIRDIASEWVDHDLEEVGLGREAYLRLLGRHAHFPTDEWPKALRQAVQLVVAHLVRPVPTLVHFIFGDEVSQLPAEDVLRRTGYFMAYSYLSTAVEAYVEKNGKAPVGRRNLSGMLSKVDGAMTRDWSPQDWSRALHPLHLLAESADHSGIPLPLLEAFFDDKELPVLSARVRAFARTKNISELDNSAIEEALTPHPEPEIVLEIPPPLPETPQDPGAKEAASVPLWKKFQSSASAQPEVVVPPDGTGEPLWKRFAGGSQEEDTALLVLERVVLGEAGSRRSTFVTELFAGSETEYGRLLGKLRGAPSWAKASQILGEDLFRKYRIDIYGPTAVDFTNAVETRFRDPA